MSNVPTNLIPTRITGLPEYVGSSTLGYIPYVLEGRTYKVQFANIAAVGAVPSTRVIATGNGLEGGGDLSQNRTISIIPHGVGYSQLDFTGVTAGVYGAADTIPSITVDETGRITNIADVPVVLSNYVPSSRTVTAGAGLTGGGQLNNNITIALNPSNATPQSLGVASAGTGTQAARDDHVHPAVDLTDTSETQGVLPLGRGGTGVDLSPVLGAVIYADNDSLNQTPAGNVGQVLTSAGGLGAPYWQTISGIGTVTSIDVSGGSTGLTTSGGPVTTVGTITIGGTLAPTSGGTGITSYAVGDLLFANTTTSLDKLTVGSNGYLLASNGTAPQYTNPASVTVGAATTAVTATNLAGGAGGSIPYQSSAGTTTFLASGTGVLTASGGNPSYTMSPSLTQVTVAADPTSALQVATKQYVDTIATTSIHYHTPVKYEVPNTTGNLNATYNNGTSGVGATLTNAGTLGAFTPDGVVASVGDRILIYNQTNAAQNGVYTVTTVGNGSTPWVLTRATDANTYDPISPNALGGGDAFFVTSGNTGAGETYVCNNVGPITFGTTAITFVQVSATQVYSAGTGLTLTGTTFSLTAPVATSLGGTGLSSFTSGGAVYATSTSALTTGTLPVTAGGTGATSLTSGYLVKGNGTSAASASVVYDTGTNVGIGTSSPAQKLAVDSGAATAIALFTSSAATNCYIRVANTATGGSSLDLASGAAGHYVFGNSTIPLVFGTNGNERMRIDGSSGNVGIGTNSPSAKLDVAGTGYFSDNVTLSRTNTAGSLSGMTITNAGTTSAYAGININSGTVTSQFFNDAAGNAVVAGAILRTTTNHPLVFGTNATERMRISSGGSVSIGTTSVLGSALLSVAGKTQADAAVAGDVIANYNNSSATGYGMRIGGGASGAGYALSVNNYAGTELMQVTGAGNVGIGTSGPTEKLVLNSGSAVQTATKYINTNTTGVTVGAAADGSAFVYQASALPFIVYTNASEKFRIASSGAIGLSGANYGSAGQVLTSNGSGSAPTWQAASGGLSRAQVTAISMILGF